MQTARGPGIVPIVSAGNEGYSDSLAWSAAYSNVVSMDAVYDADLGSIGYGICSNTTAADKVACFFNSASFLTLLAPGAAIVAADLTQTGTSQATPHVAGAAVILAAAYPNEDSTAHIARLQQSMNVTDTRNGIIKPRIDLATVITPSNPFQQPQPTVESSTTEDLPRELWRLAYQVWTALITQSRDRL